MEQINEYSKEDRTNGKQNSWIIFEARDVIFLHGFLLNTWYIKKTAMYE